MKDEEFVELKRRFLLGLFIALIIVIPILIILFLKFDEKKSTIIKKIDNKETFFLFVENNSCKNCQNFRKILNNEHIDYIVLKENTKEYDKILDKISISNDDIIFPTIIYIKEGKHYANLPNITNKKDLEEFINNYKE